MPNNRDLAMQTVKMSSSMRDAAEKFWNTEAVQAMKGFFSNIYGSIKGHIDEVLGPFREVIDMAVESVKKIAGFFKGIFAPLFSRIFGIGRDDTGEEQVSWLKKIYRFFVKDAARRNKRLARAKGDERGRPGLITAALILLGGVILGFVGQTVKTFKRITKGMVGVRKLSESVIIRLKKFFKMEGRFGKFTKFFGKIFGAEGYIAKVSGKLGGLIAKIEKAGIIGRIFKIGKFFGVFLWWFGLIWNIYKGFTEAGEGVAAKIRGVVSGIINWLLELPVLFYNWVIAPIFGLKKISITRKKISDIILAATQWVTDHITIPLWDFFNVTLPGLWQSFKERILGIGDTIKAGLESAWEGIKGLFSGIGEAIAEGVKGVWDFIKDLFNPAKIAEAIKEKLKVPDWVPGFGDDKEEKEEPKPMENEAARKIEKANEIAMTKKRERERNQAETQKQQLEATEGLGKKVDESKAAAQEANMITANAMNYHQNNSQGTDTDDEDDSLLGGMLRAIFQ